MAGGGSAAAATLAASTPQPVVKYFFGYPFEVAPLIVCICAVVITRVIIGLQAKGKGQWTVDVAITALCLLVTILWVQEHRLGLLSSGLTGVGIGAIGAGIIGFAKGAVAGRLRAALNGFMGLDRDAPKA